MRLLRRSDTSDFNLTQFRDGETPPYAILSHTWGADTEEVTFEDLINGTGKDKPSYEKIRCCEEQARKHGLEYFWVDTCCINKASTAELSEAINSMFRFNQEAQICIAFLSDWNVESESFDKSKWFTRGWTLQELIAPPALHFYDQGWRYRGTKGELASKIHRVTGISTGVLQGSSNPEDEPVAVRMSWASGRRTTRIEDMAYCLLGIFDINMPMLYGEGTRAFLRLQEEIIKQSADMSIFAWKSDDDCQKYTGLLASSPNLFKDMRELKFQSDPLQLRKYEVTNRGIRFHMPLAQEVRRGYFLLPINHGYEEKENRGIFLRQVGMDLFVRACPSQLVPVHGTGAVEYMTIKNEQSFHVKTLTPQQSSSINDRVLSITIDATLADLSLHSVRPMGSWDPSQKCLYAGHTGTFLGYMHFEATWSDEYDSFVLVCYFTKSRWKYGLVRGDHWRDIKAIFHEYFSNGNHLQEDEMGIELPHLWQEHKAKRILVSMNGSSLRGQEASLWLRLGATKAEESE